MHSTAQHSTAQHSTAHLADELAAQQSFLNQLDKDLWDSACKLWKELDAANYKHIVLGLIFLKYVSDSFTAQREIIAQRLSNPDSEYYLDPELFSEQDRLAELEERDHYTVDNVFWLPKEARWDEIRKVVRSNLGDTIWNDKKFKGVANLIDDAFEAIERENPKLKGIITRVGSFGVSENTLIELIDLFSNTNFIRPSYNGKPLHLAAKDILGHVYEYFLGEFALLEGKKGGQYFTPKSIVTLIIEMLEPYQGRVYDPAMGSGGFFAQTERFIREHQGNIHNISIYGQESNRTTWQLAVMNLAIRGLSFDLKHGDTLCNPQHLDKKMDFVMANPPFNQNDWWNESLSHDPRWQFGTPSDANANFAWIEHMIYHLSNQGKMGLVLANGSMSSQQNNEDKIRRSIVLADLVEAMIALPSNLFTNATVPACIWIINKAKKRKGEVLFIDARNLGYMKTRALRDFTPNDIAQVQNTYHNWQKQQDYENIPAFCYSASLDEIKNNDFVLTPGRYVGAAETEDDGIPFAEKMQTLTVQLRQQFQKSAELEAKIKQNLAGLGFEI